MRCALRHNPHMPRTPRELEQQLAEALAAQAQLRAVLDTLLAQGEAVFSSRRWRLGSALLRPLEVVLRACGHALPPAQDASHWRALVGAQLGGDDDLPAGLEHAVHLVQRAFRVRHQSDDERHGDGVEALVRDAERIALLLGERVRVDHQPAFRFHGETRTWRAVEEVSLHIDRPRLSATQHIFAGLNLHTQTFRHEVFDRPANAAGNRFLAVDEDLRAPDAARR